MGSVSCLPARLLSRSELRNENNILLVLVVVFVVLVVQVLVLVELVLGVLCSGRLQ